MAKSRNLSKSKILAFRQCPRRLWLEIHHPEMRVDSASTQASFSVGHTVGEIARKLFDPKGEGLLIDAQAIGFDAAFELTHKALEEHRPIFEGGFRCWGALAFADVLLPVSDKVPQTWAMVEVKSSGEVKDYHREDLAIQYYIARKDEALIVTAALAHVDTSWVYPGNGNYEGLLVPVDLTDEVYERKDEVGTWISQALDVADQDTEPTCATGPHCREPFECGFIGHCQSMEPVAAHPVAWLPRVQAQALKKHLSRSDVYDMEHVPDKLLNRKQLRVKQHTLDNSTYFDATGAAQALAHHSLPGLFLDFETIRFVVPIWVGTRPYQQIPFQFSLHWLDNNGQLKHAEYLDLSGDDPSESFAAALVKACRPTGPIFVYNKSFEGARIRDLAERFPSIRPELDALLPRLVDLLPVAEGHFYHPSQQGSWSIKKVLPAMAPELRYESLSGVQDGTGAMNAYLEAIAPVTTATRMAEIERQLLAYCRLDTFAMIRVWSFLAGREDLRHLEDKA